MAMAKKKPNSNKHTVIGIFYFLFFFQFILFIEIKIAITIDIDSFLPHQIDNFPRNNNHLIWYFPLQLFDGSFVFHYDFLDLFFG